MAGCICIGAVRWQLILRSLGQRLPLGAVSRWTYVGVFSNQVLPATVGGDGLRVWLACRAGADVKRALNSVVLDRVAMLLCLAALLVASLPRLQSLIPEGQLSRLGALIVCGAVAGLIAMMTADKLPAGMLRWRVMRWLSSLARDARTFFFSARFGATVMLLSLLSVINIMVSLWLFALAFGGRGDALGILMLLPPVIAASTLPISIGGWGTRELAMIAVMGSIGMASETAALSSIWLGLASIVTTMPGALFHFFDTAPPGPLINVTRQATGA